MKTTVSMPVSQTTRYTDLALGTFFQFDGGDEDPWVRLRVVNGFLSFRANINPHFVHAFDADVKRVKVLTGVKIVLEG